MNKLYVPINNIEVDLRNLEKIYDHNITYPLVRDMEGVSITQYELFVKELKGFKYALDNRNLPYTDIVALGKPGIIIDSDLHKDILEKHLLYHINTNTCGKINRWLSDNTVKALKNLEIERTLYDYIPLNLSLTPYYRLESGEMVPTCEALNMEPVTREFNQFVNLSEFIKELNKYDDDGLKFMLNGEEIKTYDDYFKRFLKLNHDYFGRATNTIQIEVPKNRIR